MLCPRHEVEAWVCALPRASQSYIIARLTARDQALREAAAQVLEAMTPAAKSRSPLWGEALDAIRAAPLGECPQCRAEGKERR